MLSPWISVDRPSMPAERLKNTATIIEHNIYLGTPAGLFSSPIHPTYLKSTLEPNSGYPVALKINQFDPAHAEQRSDRQQVINRFSAVRRTIALPDPQKTASLFDNLRRGQARRRIRSQSKSRVISPLEYRRSLPFCLGHRGQRVRVLNMSHKEVLLVLPNFTPNQAG